jgi:ankyrin repeat protein
VRIGPQGTGMNPANALSYRADLAEYEAQAAGLWQALRAGDEAAAWRFKWLHPRFRGRPVAEVRAAELNLDDARAVIAAEYAFAEWHDLAAFSDAVRRDPAVARFEAAADAVVSGDAAGLRAMLADNPGLVRTRSKRRHRATLLHYVAANGVEGVRQKAPPNAVEIAAILLAAGAEVDALADMYDARCTTMSMLVSSAHPAAAGVQAALAETLLEFGAALDGPGSAWPSAVRTALVFGYRETAEALVRRGASVDTLGVAAGLGRVADAARLLVTSDGPERHAALALAAQHGHADVVRLLLDAGEDPDRYNPDGYHAHSTPLHQAALAGHLDVVRLLVERGARLDLRDAIYDGTPLGWAMHGGRAEVAAYLRGRMSSPP